MAPSSTSGPSAADDLGAPHVWVDAQLPPALAEWLSADFDLRASHVSELGLLTASDPAIFAAAAAYENAILVTKDSDFPKLLQQRGPPPKVVWIRTGNVSNRELRRVLQGAWPRAVELLAGDEILVEIRRNLDVAT